MIYGWSISCGIVLRWKSLDRTDAKSTLLQVMAWCRQAPSHYLSQCWPISMSPYGVTRPQWVRKKAIPYLGSVSCEYFSEAWPHYNMMVIKFNHVVQCTLNILQYLFSEKPTKGTTSYLASLCEIWVFLWVQSLVNIALLSLCFIQYLVSLDIDFIHGDIHGWSCKKMSNYTKPWCIGSLLY